MVENSWHTVPLLYLCFPAAFTLSDRGSRATNIKRKKIFFAVFWKKVSQKCWKFCKNLSLSVLETQRFYVIQVNREHLWLIFSFFFSCLTRSSNILVLAFLNIYLGTHCFFLFWSIALLYKPLKEVLNSLKNWIIYLRGKV